VPLINVPKLLACVQIHEDPDSEDGALIAPVTYAADPRFYEFHAEYRVMNFNDEVIFHVLGDASSSRTWSNTG
jgi:hypothetical protein